MEESVKSRTAESLCSREVLGEVKINDGKFMEALCDPCSL